MFRNLDRTSSLRNRYLPIIKVEENDLIEAPLYQNCEIAQQGDLRIQCCRFVFVFQIREIPDGDGELGLLTDLKVEIPPEIILVKVNYSIYLVKNSYSNDSINPQIRDFTNSSRSYRLINKVYNFDDGRSHGAGPFYIPNCEEHFVSLSQIDDSYRGEDNYIRFMVKLNSIDFYEDKNYLAKEIFLMAAPKEFSQLTTNYQKHLNRLQKEQKELKKSIKTNQLLIDGIENAIETHQEYNEVNRVNEVITEVNQRFRSNLRSNVDRIEQLKICLNDHNLNHFLKKMDLNQPQQVESDLNELKKLDLDQLYDLFGRIIELDEEILERLDELKFCGVCYSAPKNVVLTPCGHMFFCNECTTNFTSHHKLCPRCRQPYIGMETIEV